MSNVELTQHAKRIVRWLDDRLLRRRSQREVPGLATPKPYDWVIALAAAGLAAAAFWAGVADGIGTATG
jgi:hypothetical protein